MVDADVVIVGGGPVGLFLAAELRLAGVNPLVLERLAEPDPRKKDDDRGLTVRTMQTLSLRGLAEPTAALSLAAVRRLAAMSGDPAAADEAVDLAGLMQRLGMANVKGDLAMLPLVDSTGELSHVPPPVMVLQGDFEQILADRAAELGVQLWRGCEVVALSTDDTGATAILADGRTVRAAFLVGCDGGRSTIRRLAGFDFPGTDPSMVARVAVAELADPQTLPPGFVRNPAGMLIASPPPAPTMTVEFGGTQPDRHTDLTVEEFQDSLRRISASEVTVTSITNPVRLTDNARQTSTYRRGRVLLAGDAAHVHSPIGGQGLNLGLQDAANLGWKLALVVNGQAPAELLDTYTTERHPVGVSVLRNSRAETALMRTDPQTEALRELLGEILQMPQAVRHLTDMINGVRVRYDTGDSHPLDGTFATDLHLDGIDVSTLLANGRGLLLDLANDPALRNAAESWNERIDVVTATGADTAKLTAVLIRPDGYVASAVGPSSDIDNLRTALSRWFGPSAPA
jgi:2-polyprenyl-6-methoxyphenol hydroxylase-like FAD-dependent oxidoreductase